MDVEGLAEDGERVDMVYGSMGDGGDLSVIDPCGRHDMIDPILHV